MDGHNEPPPDDGVAPPDGVVAPVAIAASGARGVAQAAERTWVKRLRVFSGQRPTPSHEYDFESWDFYATQSIEDNTLEQQTQRQLLLQSLSQPVLKVARSLGREVLPESIVEVIQVSYGTTADGHSLLLKFYSCLQGTDEISSVYLQRLQSQLRKVIDAGGAPEMGNYAFLVGQLKT